MGTGVAREDRIRECAYHLWEASGCPTGREEEFWHRACDLIASQEKPASATPPSERRKAAQPARKRSAVKSAKSNGAERRRD